MQDHPRVCGEKSDKGFVEYRNAGSPPRMRGKVGYSAGKADSSRITPAYAGKSLILPAFISFYQDHPRVCGEKAANFRALCVPMGSPPRMRGKDHKGEK